MKNYDEQIAKAEEQIRQLNNKKKRLISEQKQAERKKRTKRLHKWELFCLQMSFLPLGFLCLLSFGIGTLWLVPYMNMTQTLYFLDLMQNERQ